MAVVSAPFVALDDVQSGRLRLYRDPSSILRADTAAAVPAILAAMQGMLAAGHHLAGYASYELGAALEHRLAPLTPAAPTLPLLWFGVFDAEPEMLDGPALDGLWGTGRYHAGHLRTEWSIAEYERRFAELQAFIRAGDIFQANLTFRARFSLLGSTRAFYRDLRAQGAARHGAFIHDGERDILSVSPELFFTADPSGLIQTAPMKGTAARLIDPDDDARQRDALAASPKDRAENLMIVDLLRSDLGRIATTGSVSVDSLYDVETYPTLHAMVSRISACLAHRHPPETILRALFPCGSVTGAPKIRAMEIIDALEDSPRGVYCGAIGHFAPGGAAQFNVAIRTITVQDGRGELGAGGAVTLESTAAGEWAEALLKTVYFQRARRPVILFETLRHQMGRFERRDRHLDRMARSAATFGIPFDESKARAALLSAIVDQRAPLRIRLSLHEDGRFAVIATALAPARTFWRVAISAHTLDSQDVFLRHKTVWRDDYERERRRLSDRLGVDEVLFLNERGELCEGSRSNVFVEFEGELLTPPVEAGLLPGCLRAELLDHSAAREAVLRLSDLPRAGRILFGNSLRGLVPAVLLDLQRH